MQQMSDSYISFYLKANRIHLFVKAQRDLGCPNRVCFLLDPDGKTLVMVPHAKRDLISHSISADTYRGMKYMEVCSKKLCRILARSHDWDLDSSYRIPGIVFIDQHIAKYDLTRAQLIKTQKNNH